MRLRDAESRVAAVKALANAAAELFPLKPEAWTEAAAALCDRVLRPLLSAADDYCTDDRGDVGSWVREAAMCALVRIFPLWAGHNRAARSAQPPGPAAVDASAYVILEGVQRGPPTPVQAMAGEYTVQPGAEQRIPARAEGQGCKGLESTTSTKEQQAYRAEQVGLASLRGVLSSAAAAEQEPSCDDISADVARALLKQGAERLDRLRKVGAIST